MSSNTFLVFHGFSTIIEIAFAIPSTSIPGLLEMLNNWALRSLLGTSAWILKFILNVWILLLWYFLLRLNFLLIIFTLAFPILKSILIKNSELRWAWLLSTSSILPNSNSCFFPFFYFPIFLKKYILSFLLIIIKCRQPKILVPSEGSMRDWHIVGFHILVINIWYPFIAQSWLCIP